jgi:hypothetical protein
MYHPQGSKPRFTLQNGTTNPGRNPIARASTRTGRFTRQPDETMRMLCGSFTHQRSAVRYRPRPPVSMQVNAIDATTSEPPVVPAGLLKHLSRWGEGGEQRQFTDIPLAANPATRKPSARMRAECLMARAWPTGGPEHVVRRRRAGAPLRRARPAAPSPRAANRCGRRVRVSAP